MQLHADLCADLPGCLNLMTETVVYRKLLDKASIKLSKTSKLITVIISFYLISVCCQSTSSTIFLQSFLQLSIVLVSLSAQLIAKLEFDSLILSICHSQFRELITTVEVFHTRLSNLFIMTDNNIFEVSEISVVVNLNTYMTSITENSFSYLSFDLYLISIYKNN